jgi:hypothetical protein
MGLCVHPKNLWVLINAFSHACGLSPDFSVLLLASAAAALLTWVYCCPLFALHREAAMSDPMNTLLNPNFTYHYDKISCMKVRPGLAAAVARALVKQQRTLLVSDRHRTCVSLAFMPDYCLQSILCEVGC